MQIAKYLGAYVIGTSSARNQEFVLSCGADEHLDYREVDFTDELEGIDFCLEAQDGSHFERTVEVMRHEGTIVTLLSGLGESARKAAKAKSLNVNYFMSVFPNGENMQQMAKPLESGAIRPHVSKTFGLAGVTEAHREIEAGRTVGELILDVL